ncbi:ATP-binding cassette domain-containing protein, partial [Gammaproteobacteria bacterium PRO2]|nr:ATP-binding cassette domain-containing protein [Gammaproteobacteria bacterium PRO2]
ARARRELGHKVFVVDPFGVTKGEAHAFNLLDRLDTSDPACVGESAVLADCLVIPDPKGQAHFDESARTLLQGLMLHVAGLDEGRRNLPEVRRILTAGEEVLFETLAEMAADEKAAFGLPARAANTIMGMPDRERGSVISTAQKSTAFMDDPRIAAAVSRSDFNLANMKAELMTVYMVLPANKIGPNARFVRAFIGSVIAAITSSTTQPMHRVAFLLDEFGQLGYMKQIEDAVSLMRGYGLAFWVFIQDLSQLKGVYPKWQTFLANSAKSFYGTDDYDTAKYISDSLGKATIEFETENTGRNSGTGVSGGGGSLNRGKSSGSSQQFAGRELLTPDEVMRAPRSLTGQYLAGRLCIAVPPARQAPDPQLALTVRGARGNNLRGVTVAVPVGLMTCVTGVSGSGKSTLVNDTLYRHAADRLHQGSHDAAACDGIDGLEHIDRVIDIDQSPIGRTPRSNPATYTGLFTPVRELFAATQEARSRGYDAGRFSFNVKGGRCEACQGDGVIRVEMHFLADVYVPCDVCHGQRYNRETLEVRYKGRSISETLDMTVEEALGFFANIPAIAARLQTLVDVGLGYLRLGQNATTLSGGEAQRVKLSRELSKRATGRTLYILDEPTTGLHFQDVAQLLAVLLRLREQGNTVVVIEHNLDVIKTADWIIDLGPEGGEGGGEVVATGTPETVAANPRSFTGRFLAPVLARSRDAREQPAAS